jgi:ABC-type bacteriocin/lantibiotic exporter with double-glycine peptidase domain
VAACVRIVLAHYGDVRTEAELRSLLDTQPTGTPARNVMRLSGCAFEVHLRPWNLPALQQVLTTGQPPIVFVQTGTLQYWSVDIFHSAVLTGLDATTAALHDPYFATAPQTTSLETFEKAWAQTGQLTAFVRPRNKP